MIQELFGGNHVSILGGGDRSTINNNNLSNQILNPTHSQSSSPSPSPSSSNVSTTTTTPTPAQNLRCPRCDSSNTKFCYYNNYNLTQPRHFCKTCRRYWTKGGALRNVPIGGGCRKNKTTTISSPGKSVSAPGKMIKTEHGKSPLFNGFDSSELSTNPILWPSTHNSHLLSLLRANPNLNPNLNQNPNHISNHASSFIKDDGLMFGSSHHFPTNGLNERALGLDSFGGLQVSSLGLSNNNNNNNSYYNNRNHQQGIMFGEAENNGLQELYQRLRSTTTTTNCYQENAPVIIGHVASGPSNSSSASILDSAPVVASAGGGNFLNPSLYWQLTTDQATANAAFP